MYGFAHRCFEAGTCRGIHVLLLAIHQKVEGWDRSPPQDAQVQRQYYRKWPQRRIKLTLHFKRGAK